MIFFLLNLLFLNYVYLKFEKLDELLNAKYTKYTDSVCKHHCVPNSMKIFKKKTSTFKLHKNLDSKRTQLL